MRSLGFFVLLLFEDFDCEVEDRFGSVIGLGCMRSFGGRSQLGFNRLQGFLSQKGAQCVDASSEFADDSGQFKAFRFFSFELRCIGVELGLPGFSEFWVEHQLWRSWFRCRHLIGGDMLRVVR